MPSASRWRGSPMLLDARQGHPPARRHAGAAAARHGRPGGGRIPQPDPAQGGAGAGRARSPSRSSIRRAWATRSAVSGPRSAMRRSSRSSPSPAGATRRSRTTSSHHHETGRPLVIVAGIEAHVCVLQSGIDLGRCRVRRLRGGGCHVVARTLRRRRWPWSRMRAGRGLGGQHGNGGLRTARPGRNGGVQGALGTCPLNAGPPVILPN